MIAKGYESAIGKIILIGYEDTWEGNGNLSDPFRG